MLSLIKSANSSNLVCYCTYLGGPEGPKVKLDSDIKLVLFGELEAKITGITSGYVTFIQAPGIGGDIRVMNLRTGTIKSVSVGILGNGEFHYFEHVLNCSKKNR